ncbi:MAG: 4Fe-4S binding protein [Oligoflexia bacterium]|nr:4Fe-4S binding protein [Oligoflexia bacterium]
MKIKIDKQKCPQDHKCPAVSSCPEEALLQDKFEAPRVDVSKCILCKVCVDVCPKGAIHEEED